MNKKVALVLGGSGLVGFSLIQQLLNQDQYQQIRLVGRRSIGITHPKLLEKIIPFDHLLDLHDFFKVDDVFCCLGTTMKKAKSRETFRKVDLIYPIQAANMSNKTGVKQFLIITALNANKKSKFFYSRIKGEVEEALRLIPLPSIHIFQPSLLLGARKEFRLGEKIANFLAVPFSYFMLGPLAPYRPIHAQIVAQAMIYTAICEQLGFHIHPSNEIEKLGKKLGS